jgi:hypothetical protein
MRRRIRTLAAVAVAVLAGVLAAPAAQAAPGDRALDARAAAGIGGTAQPATASWYSGTVAVGASKTYYWNASGGVVFEVGFSPLGASSPAVPCQFEVTRQWYVQTTAGKRQFWWTFKNVGQVACGANVMLTHRAQTASFAVGGLNPGQSTTKYWDNLDETKSVYKVGLTPTGATSTKECHMEVTRTWFVRDWADKQIWMTIKNIGTIACATTVVIANMDNDIEIMTPDLYSGQEWSSQLNNANPLTVTYWLALGPRVFKDCKLEAVREHYVQRVNANGTTEREFRFTIKNVGVDACDGGVLITKVGV